MFLWLLTLYLKVEPMAPFLFLHHYMDATMYLRKKATLIGVFGKSGCLFAETQVVSPKKGNRKN